MPNPFTSHPVSVGESYREHLGFALAFGVRMILGGSASRTLDELNERRARGARRAPAAER